jgi:hypothetical protein
MRGPAFFACANDYLIDVKFGVIMDVEASRAIRQAVALCLPTAASQPPSGAAWLHDASATSPDPRYYFNVHTRSCAA